MHAARFIAPIHTIGLRIISRLVNAPEVSAVRHLFLDHITASHTNARNQ